MNVLDRTAGISAFAERLHAIGAVKIDTEKGFRMKIHDSRPEAPLSPIFTNLRTPTNLKPGPLDYEDTKAVAHFFYDYLREKKVRYDGILGIPRAGEPFAEALQSVIYYSERRHVPVLRMEKIDERDGQKRKIGKITRFEDLPRGCTVLATDDLITGSDSKIEAIEVLRTSGFLCTDCIVFLDREQGGAKNLAALKDPVTLHSITTLREILVRLNQKGRITHAQFETITQYLDTNS